MANTFFGHKKIVDNNKKPFLTQHRWQTPSHRPQTNALVAEWEHGMEASIHLLFYCCFPRNLTFILTKRSPESTTTKKKQQLCVPVAESEQIPAAR